MPVPTASAMTVHSVSVTATAQKFIKKKKYPPPPNSLDQVDVNKSLNESSMAVPCFNKEQAYIVCNHGTTKLGTNMLLGIFIHSMRFVFLNTTVDNKFADFQHNLFAIIHVSQDANWLYQRKHLARTYLINAACITVNVVI